MESLDRRLLLTGAGIAGLAAVSAAAKAGSLNPPPGPVSPTGKTTTEIEPRTAVQSLAADGTAMKVITQPGSYYLTGNLAGGAAGAAGIAIAASNVTLDLCGFAVTGAGGMTSGIELRGAIANVTVRNGSLVGWPVAGVKALAAGTRNVKLERLAVSDCTGAGIDLTTAGAALGATVSGCTVAGCGGGINVGFETGVVENCQVTQVSTTTTASGVAAATVRGCFVSGVTGSGASSVYGIRGDSIAECAVREVHSGGNGVSTGIAGNSVTGCSVFSVSRNSSTGVGQGISGRMVANCFVEQVGGGTSTSIQYGISATGIVTGCTVSFIGASNASSLARGINAEVAENCRVNQVNSLSTLVGIQATYMARGCSISSMNHLGTGAGSITGIETGNAIDCQVDSISGNTNGLVTGINANRLVSACSVMSVDNGGAGGAVSINAVAGAQVTGCMVAGGAGTGIRCLSVTKVTGCQVADATIGIDCGAGSLVDGNNVSGSTTGIKTTGASTVVRNHVTGAATPYNVAAAGQVGPIVSATGTIASTNPWANFQG